MEFKFNFSDLLLAQFKAGLHFCDVTLLQRNWNLILASPSADPDLVAVYTSHSPALLQLRGSKAQVMQCCEDTWEREMHSSLRSHPAGGFTREQNTEMNCCEKATLDQSRVLKLMSFDNTFTLIKESEVRKHDQIKMHCKVKKNSWILNKICFAYKDLKFCLIANKVWIIIKPY